MTWRKRDEAAMAMVSLRYFGPLRLRLDLKWEGVELKEGATLEDPLERSRGRHGELFARPELAAYVVFPDGRPRP